MLQEANRHTSTHKSSGPRESRRDKPGAGSYPNYYHPIYYHPISGTSDPDLGFSIHVMCLCVCVCVCIESPGPRSLQDGGSGGREFQHQTADSTRAERSGGIREVESTSRSSLGRAVTARPGLLPAPHPTPPPPRLPGLRASTGGSMEDGEGKLALRRRGKSPEGRGLVTAPPSHSLLEHVPRATLHSRTPAAASLRRVFSCCSRGR